VQQWQRLFVAADARRRHEVPSILALDDDADVAERGRGVETVGDLEGDLVGPGHEPLGVDLLDLEAPRDRGEVRTPSAGARPLMERASPAQCAKLFRL
jgi:hypothetical protein